MESRIGSLYIVASKRGLRGIFWKKKPGLVAKSLRGAGAEIQILARAVRQVGEYLDGKRKVFDVPLDPLGTRFQKLVWRELRRIPYGKTRSYADIARRIESAKAARAVGAANGKNPLCIVVPCHRVIASDGSVGGYSGPVGVKNRLLELERAV